MDRSFLENQRFWILAATVVAISIFVFLPLNPLEYNTSVISESSEVDDSAPSETQETGSDSGDSESRNALQNGLQAHYRFDSPEVSRGNSLEFDGSDDFVDLPGSVMDLNEGEPITVTAWMKGTQSDAHNVIVGHRDPDNCCLKLELDDGHFSVETNGPGGTDIDGTKTVNDGEWHFGVFTYQSDGTTTLYVDGVSEEESSGNNNGFTASETAIGRRGHESSEHFKGKIDEVRIYNRSLSDSEVEDLYNERPVSGEGLVLHQDFNEGPENCDLASSNACLEDKSGTGNDGTPQNFDDNSFNSGSGWFNETPLNRPSLKDSSGHSNLVRFYGEGDGTLENFGSTSADSYWDTNAKQGSYALKFDNDYNRINISQPNFELSAGSTLSLWLKPRQLGSADHSLYPGIFSVSQSGSYNEWITLGEGDGDIKRAGETATLQVGIDTDAGTRANLYYNDYLVSEWIHITLVRKQDGDLEYYINGDYEETDTIPSDETFNLNYLGMGYGGATNDGSFNGTMDGVRIYDRNLTESEVQSLYNGEKVREGLIGEWKFEEGNGEKAYDTSSLDREGVLGSSGVDMNYSEYTDAGSVDSDEFTLSVWTDLDEYSYFDGFSVNTSERYFVEEYNDRGSGPGFVWDTDQEVVESDESNDDINLLKNTSLEWPLVFTEARTDDNDGVGVAIDNGSYIYEAVVSNDHPGDTGIYRRDTGDSNNLVDAENSYDGNDWHRIGLGYNGSYLKMYVNGSLEASYEVGYLDPVNIGLVSDANNPPSTYRYLEAYDNKAVILGNSPDTFALSRHEQDVRGYYNGEDVSVPASDSLTHYALRFDGSELGLFRQGELQGTKSANGLSESKNLFAGKNVGMGTDEVRIYNRSLSQQEIQQLAFQ